MFDENIETMTEPAKPTDGEATLTNQRAVQLGLAKDARDLLKEITVELEENMKEIRALLTRRRHLNQEYYRYTMTEFSATTAIEILDQELNHE